jgi:hypothetical protein
VTSDWLHQLQITNHQSLKLGAIAQLGEHLLCKQGVVGSIPTGSTNSRIEYFVKPVSLNKTSFTRYSSRRFCEPDVL